MSNINKGEKLSIRISACLLNVLEETAHRGRRSVSDLVGLILSDACTPGQDAQRAYATPGELLSRDLIVGRPIGPLLLEVSAQGNLEASGQGSLAGLWDIEISQPALNYDAGMSCNEFRSPVHSALDEDEVPLSITGQPSKDLVNVNLLKLSTFVVGPEKRKYSPRVTTENLRLAVDWFDQYFRRSHEGAKPVWNGARIKMMKNLVRSLGLQELKTRLERLEQSPPDFPPAPWDVHEFSRFADKLAKPKELSGAEYALSIANSEP